MTAIWRLRGSRQARYGIRTGRADEWLTLRESFGEVDLSVEVGEGVEPVGQIADDATTEQQWTALARWEGWTATTYASQLAAREADWLADDQSAET